MKKRSILSDNEKQKIEQAVAEAERLTSGEIVVKVVEESDSYSQITALFALMGIVLGTLFFYLMPLFRQWESSHAPLGDYELLKFQTLGLVVLFIFSKVQMLRRMPIQREILNESVRKSAMANFLFHGIGHTRDRTGVLVYISLFERKVEIIGDKAIHEKVGTSFWDEEVRLIVSGAKKNLLADSICESVKQIGERLKQEFPIKTDDTDELPNTVVDDS